jgi:hypothetical protein
MRFTNRDKGIGFTFQDVRITREIIILIILIIIPK